MPDTASFIPALPFFAAYLVAVVIIAITPGPDMTLFIGKTVGQSRAAGIAAFLGASTGLVGHTCLAALGLSALLAASATAFTVLKFAGAAYLVYLAYEAIRHGSSLRLKSGAAPEPLPAIYAKGLAVNLLNPKVIMFFVTFLPQFVSPHDPNAVATLFFLGFSFVVLQVPISLGLIFSADRLSGWLRRSPRATRAIDYVFAGVMGAFAVRLVLAEGRS